MGNDDDGTKVLVPNERIFERTQGCWNCKHSISAKPLWERNKPLLLVRILNSGLPEDHQKIHDIKKMVNDADHGVASGGLIACGRKPRGKTALGNYVADLIPNSFLCGDWSGAVGASVARGGQKADKLPEELVEDLDGKVGIGLDLDLAEKAIREHDDKN